MTPQQKHRTKISEAPAWFAGRLPDDWFTEAPEITHDSDEILVVGRLAEPEVPAGNDGAGADDAARDAARSARIRRFREDTREQRIRIAQEAEHEFGRKVSWGAECGDVRHIFTSVSLPVMTRLRLPDRSVLDTLVESGVARSRSEALAWCVRLVGRHEADWLRDLRDALTHVHRVRAEGPRPI